MNDPAQEPAFAFSGAGGGSGTCALTARNHGLPWEPKAAFHALADYGQTRARSDKTDDAR